MDRCRAEGWEVGTLINNAGLGYQGRFDRSPPEKVTSMLEVNINALVELTRAFLPGMVERRDGVILNIASIAAFQPVPYLALYSASKSLVLHFSEALFREVRKAGVFVGALCPGPVATEFHEGAAMEAQWFEGGQTADEIAEIALDQMKRRQPVRWTHWAQEAGSRGQRLLPRAWVRALSEFMMSRARGK